MPLFMEVHHHPHAPKKWFHYLWEFLMLFLAVFCGFLAENFREHSIEKERENTYMKSLVEDLKADSVNIGNRILVRLEKSKTYDSIRQSVFQKKYVTNGADLYYWVRIYSRNTILYLTDGTLQQLKNAGGMRLIHKQQVVDSLLAYETNFKGISFAQEVEMGMLAEYRDLVSKIFDA